MSVSSLSGSSRLDVIQLMLVIDGPVYLQVEEERHTLHSGDYFLLKPWQPHWGRRLDFGKLFKKSTGVTPLHS